MKMKQSREVKGRSNRPWERREFTEKHGTDREWAGRHSNNVKPARIVFYRGIAHLAASHAVGVHNGGRDELGSL